MNIQPKYWLILYIVFCVTNILAEFIDNHYLVFATKPLLLVFLSFYFYTSTLNTPSRFRRYILLGLILSIVGDTTLMFVENPPYWKNFFLLGLGSFLLTHIFYLLAFLNYPSNQKGLVQKKTFLIIPFIIFLIANNFILWDGIEAAMKIPVLVYSTTIVLMALSCLNLNQKITLHAWQQLFLGVMLFVVSDTIIGLNKFNAPIPYARLLIMLFYLVGQYFIVTGSILINNNRYSKNE